MTPPPVLIPIHSSEQVPEWAMLEINGELIQPKELSVDGKENPASHDDDELPLIASDSVELGAVRFDEENQPIMVLGTHELKGKVEKLKQPFCILEKKSTSGSDDGTGAESYEVTGVVKQKLLFNQYPKIIMR